MDGLQILNALRFAGVTVRLVEPDKLRLEPASKIPAEILPRIRAAKPAILEVLRSRPATCVASCYEIDAGRWQKAKRGKIQPYTKTESGTELECEDGEIIGRDVDLSKELAARLRTFIGNRRSGLVFCKENGEQLPQRDILKNSLHPILEKLEHAKGGFNIFRRFRITLLRTSECPDALQHLWSGHAQTHVSERYTKLLRQRDFRLDWAEKIGPGFELPKAPISNLSNLIEFRRVG